MDRLLFPSLISPAGQELRLEAFMILNKSWILTSVKVIEHFYYCVFFNFARKRMSTRWRFFLISVSYEIKTLRVE